MNHTIQKLNIFIKKGYIMEEKIIEVKLEDFTQAKRIEYLQSLINEYDKILIVDASKISYNELVELGNLEMEKIISVLPVKSNQI